MNLSQNNYSAIKKSFDWLDNDKDGKISIVDIQVSFNIQHSEAKSLFESLSTLGNPFIDFEEFSQGLLNFPSLIQQFQEDPCPDSPTNKSLHSFSFHSNPEEDILDSYYSQVEVLPSLSKDNLLSLVHDLANFAQNIKSKLSDITELNNSKNFEFQLQIETMANERIKVEKKYEDLLAEQIIFEETLKGLEEKLMRSEYESRENRLKVSELLVENENHAKFIEELNICIEDKEKVIKELNKTVSNHAKVVSLGENLNPNRSKSNSFQLSKTPRSGKFNEEYMEKTEIINGLKTQLNQKTFECEKLDKKLAQVNIEKLELMEKVRFLSLQKIMTEEDEDTKSDAISSLKDELFRIDPGFTQANRVSFLTGKAFKDVALQVNFKRDLRVERQKKREWCFSIFG